MASLNPDAPLYQPLSQLPLLPYEPPTPPHLLPPPAFFCVPSRPLPAISIYMSPSWFALHARSPSGEPIAGSGFPRLLSFLPPHRGVEVKEEGGEKPDLGSSFSGGWDMSKKVISRAAGAVASGKAARWLPKDRPLPLLVDDYEFKDEKGEGFKSTVMVKNLPNKFSKEMLVELLDAHCRKENQAGDGALSEYDFVYLPIDFSTGHNLGYAFVNFTTPVAAARLHRELHRRRAWDDHGSRKVCEVTYARIQGLSALVSHFRNSCFVCESADYLPVQFNPGRNGLRQSDERRIGNYYHALRGKRGRA